MKLLNGNSLKHCLVKSLRQQKVFSNSTGQPFNGLTRRGFTLIELILVMALLVIITSIAAPAMSKFVRGRALNSESLRLAALMHMAQGRAVSEGEPMILWINEKQGSYGVQAETPGPDGDPKAEELQVDATLQISVLNTATMPFTFQNLPAIKFLPDGSVDEGSPQTLKLDDSDGFARWLVELPTHLGYEIRDTGQ